MKKTLIIAVLALSFVLMACQHVPNVQTDAQLIAQTEKEHTHKAKHLCGALTRNGGKCQHPVKHEGELCWVHKPIVPCGGDEDCSEKNGRNGDPK